MLGTGSALCRHSLHPNVSDEPRDVTSFARLRQAGPG